MAGLGAILKALGRATWRELRRLESVGANNFFLFCFANPYMLFHSGFFLQIVFGLLLLVPLSADPLRKIPAVRLAAWPLPGASRLALRAASVWLSPVSWIAAALFAWASTIAAGVQILVFAGCCYAAGIGAPALLARAPEANPLRHIPPLPGRLGGLVSKNLRQMLGTLDIYLALMLTAGGVCYRAFAKAPDPDAPFVLALMGVLAFSTWTQCLFGLDSAPGFTRYHLLPLRGWEILAAKDAAFLLLLLAVVAPLAPVPGLAAGLVTLAVGHSRSVKTRSDQSRWRFTGGASVKHSFVQIIGIFFAGSAAYRSGAWVLGPCAALWLLSLWRGGRALELNGSE